MGVNGRISPFDNSPRLPCDGHESRLGFCPRAARDHV